MGPGTEGGLSPVGDNIIRAVHILPSSVCSVARPRPAEEAHGVQHAPVLGDR
jgi:hypothetical protein